MDGGSKIVDLLRIVTPDIGPIAFELAYDKLGRDARVHGGAHSGRTVLHEAVVQGNYDLVRHIVVKYGELLVNIGDAYGNTPLYAAANLDDHQLSLGIVKFFADCGAFFDICGTDVRAPKTALMAARLKGNKLVEDYLVKRGAHDDERTESSVPAATKASEQEKDSRRPVKRARSTKNDDNDDEPDDGCCEYRSGDAENDVDNRHDEADDGCCEYRSGDDSKNK